MSLKNEIQKLAMFLEGKKHVSIEHVLEVVPRTRPENIFALSRAIGQQNLSSALLCLTHLLEDHQSEIGVLALVIRHIRILSRVKEGIMRKYSKKALCELVGVPSFFIQNYIEEAGMWTEANIRSAVEQLKITDEALKSSSLPPSLWLERFIIKTCVLY